MFESIGRFINAVPALDERHFKALLVTVFAYLMIIAVLIIMARFKHVRLFAALLALIPASFIIFICIFFPNVKMLYAHPGGNPQAPVDAFFTALSEGRMADGYDALYGNATARAEGDTAADKYYSLVTDGFSYEYIGDMTVNGLSAQIDAKVNFTDLDTMTAGIEDEFYRELDGIVQSHSRREVYGNDDSYEEWVIDSAYEAAEKKILEGKAPSSSEEIKVDLEFADGEWKITPTDDLLRIMGAGVLGEPDSDKDLYDKTLRYGNNVKASVVSDLMYIPKLYSIPEEAVCGYEPDPEGYNVLEDPQEIYDVLAANSHLIGCETLVFDPNVKFAKNQKVQYYSDDSIFVIVWKEYCNDTYCTFAEVFVSDGSQLRRKISGDKFGNSVQKPASALATEAKAVIAMNGDFYKFRANGVSVYDRTVCRFVPNLDTCFFTSDGDMIFSYAGDLKSKEEAQQFVDDNDIVFSTSFGPILVDNGVPKSNLNYRIGETMHTYSRSAIGQMGERHYLMLVIGCIWPSTLGCYIEDEQNIMILKGCENAYALDGGQTAEIVWKNKMYNLVDFGEEREVSDIIYFATAVPENER